MLPMVLQERVIVYRCLFWGKHQIVENPEPPNGLGFKIPALF